MVQYNLAIDDHMFARYGLLESNMENILLLFDLRSPLEGMDMNSFDPYHA